MDRLGARAVGTTPITSDSVKARTGRPAPKQRWSDLVRTPGPAGTLASPGYVVMFGGHRLAVTAPQRRRRERRDVCVTHRPTGVDAAAHRLTAASIRPASPGSMSTAPSRCIGESSCTPPLWSSRRWRATPSCGNSGRCHKCLIRVRRYRRLFKASVRFIPFDGPVGRGRHSRPPVRGHHGSPGRGRGQPDQEPPVKRQRDSKDATELAGCRASVED
jgi:hypothetical protein